MNISLSPELLFHIGSFGITNTYIVSTLLVVCVGLFGVFFRTRVTVGVPHALQNALEVVCDHWISTIDSVVDDKRLSLKFFPLVVSIFLFVFLSNLVELIPGLGTIGIYGMHKGEIELIPLIRSASADLNMTLALAFITMGSTWFYGISELGWDAHIGKFFTFKNPIAWFVGLLEFVGEFAKIISFSFRLFGNIFAGEVLLMVMAYLVPYIAGVPFLFLELFVGFVQALVFSMLALVFLKMATVSHESSEH